MQPEEPQQQTPTPQPQMVTQETPSSGPYHAERAVITVEELGQVKQFIDNVTTEFQKTVVGQDQLRISLLVALLSSGHILLESVPGLAKTTAAHTLADAISATFKRIQCTPDLLPSDIIGTQIYDYSKGNFRTELGPVHANLVLLDEINRSSAKTQSAMLEAMQERQTSIGGAVYKLPKPFMVLATQNPIEQEGTYELPEAQMDRFLLKEVLTYPTPEEEIEILSRFESGVFTNGERATVATPNDILHMQELATKVYVDDSIKNYIVSIIAATREPGKYIDDKFAKYVQVGASPRGALTLLQVAKALALMNGRGYVIPEDVQQLRYSALRHRLILNFEAVADEVREEAIIQAIFDVIQVP